MTSLFISAARLSIGKLPAGRITARKITPPPAPPSAIESVMAALLAPGRAPPLLQEPWKQLGEFALRPGKRLRPALLGVGWRAAGGASAEPAGVRRFAAALELLHAFFLVHDDVADGADTRRGGPALHRELGAGRLGEHLAVVAGDLLFVEALDAMLGCDLPFAVPATREVLAICRDTAAGQYLDLKFSEADPSAVVPSEARRAEMLKTARYSFEAPLLAGALLAGGEAKLLRALRRVARPLGLAFQLQDDLLPFTSGDACGKPALADLQGGKKTWLLTLAFCALDDLGRARLRRCLAQPDTAALRCVHGLLQESGALRRVQREVRMLIARSRRSARAPELQSIGGELARVFTLVENLS